MKPELTHGAPPGSMFACQVSVPFIVNSLIQHNFCINEKQSDSQFMKLLLEKKLSLYSFFLETIVIVLNLIENQNVIYLLF